MSEERDAYVAVEVELPNGKTLPGRPVPWRTALRIKSLLAEFVEHGNHGEDHAVFQASFDALFLAFSEATGLTEAQIAAADPDLTLLEFVDFMGRFIYRLRPGRTAALALVPTPLASA